MQRVAVVGCGGAGKSTLATALGRLTGLRVVHLDRHYWQPGWVLFPWFNGIALRAPSPAAGERSVLDVIAGSLTLAETAERTVHWSTPA